MNDERDEERMRRILGRPRSLFVPPFESLRPAPGRSVRRSVMVTLASVIVAVVALYGGRELSMFRQQQPSPTAGVAAPSAGATNRFALPQPIAQPVTRTSRAAQVAWVSTSELNPAGTDRVTTLVGADPAGKIVGRIDGAKDPGVTRARRSADGALIVTISEASITIYSALDGTVQRTFARELTDVVADVALSPDGQWLALIGARLLFVQVVDLRSGAAQETPLGSAKPGQITGGATLLFSPDSKHVYTIVDWSGPLSIEAFDVTAKGLVQTARAVDGQGGKTFRGCAGPGLAPKIVGGGSTLVVYCHVDGSVTFIDLPTLTTMATVLAEMKNPFWLAPIFTPDGQLLYLHQYPAFGDFMQVVDLRTRVLLGPVPTPTKVEQPGPFSWLFPVAFAGGTPSTVPVSPDGLRIYSVADDGIAVLRVPDLKPIAKLASGLHLSEAWISGDGKTVYATDQGKGLFVIPEGGGTPVTVTFPMQVGGFIASEHG